MEKQVTIILVTRYWETYAQAVAWLVLLGLATGFAVWVNSFWMETIMALIWIVSYVGWLLDTGKALRLTPNEAIDEIRAITEEKESLS